MIDGVLLHLGCSRHFLISMTSAVQQPDAGQTDARLDFVPNPSMLSCISNSKASHLGR